mmetsp:Transcript_28232/g.78972  ORF Transcript_28232/g.78972 Transcript_28232/m.78972 type:complete len:316 (-) Transcript_28232:1187-2134(-)
MVLCKVHTVFPNNILVPIFNERKIAEVHPNVRDRGQIGYFQSSAVVLVGALHAHQRLQFSQQLYGGFGQPLLCPLEPRDTAVVESRYHGHQNVVVIQFSQMLSHRNKARVHFGPLSNSLVRQDGPGDEGRNIIKIPDDLHKVGSTLLPGLGRPVLVEKLGPIELLVKVEQMEGGLASQLHRVDVEHSELLGHYLGDLGFGRVAKVAVHLDVLLRVFQGTEQILRHGVKVVVAGNVLADELRHLLLHRLRKVFLGDPVLEEHHDARLDKPRLVRLNAVGDPEPLAQAEQELLRGGKVLVREEEDRLKVVLDRALGG